MLKPKTSDENTVFDARWAVISAYGSRIRLAGESLEFCQAPIDDFGPELAGVEEAVKKIREILKDIRRT